MVTRERIMFIGLRQAYYLSPLNAARLSSRTILFLSVPKKDLSESRLRHIFGPAVENVSIATDCKDLQDLVDDRDDAAMKLEGTIVKFQKGANKERLKAGKSKGHGENGASNKRPDEELPQSRWVDDKARPTHKLKAIIGKKVDTIIWSRQQLTELIPQVQHEQNAHIEGHAKPLSAAFVTFATQSAAQRAFSQVSHHQLLQMSPRYIGVVPDDVIWKNLNVSWSRIPRNYLATAIISVIILFWSIPVAAIGAISNITSLIDKLPFLSFILDIPKTILGVVTGLFPAVLLTVLMLLVPIICRR
jgi:calcium permeable stress-gated cation channel